MGGHQHRLPGVPAAIANSHVLLPLLLLPSLLLLLLLLLLHLQAPPSMTWRA